MRTLLFFSFATNLTYVHTPLTLKFDSRFLSKGIEHGAMDALLGFSWGERCGKQCIDDGLNQGNLRRVVYRQKGLLEQQPRHVFSPETRGLDSTGRCPSSRTWSASPASRASGDFRTPASRTWTSGHLPEGVGTSAG